MVSAAPACSDDLDDMVARHARVVSVLSAAVGVAGVGAFAVMCIQTGIAVGSGGSVNVKAFAGHGSSTAYEKRAPQIGQTAAQGRDVVTTTTATGGH